MACGFTGMINLHESQKRFYNAVALRDTQCLTLQKSDLLQIIESLEKRSQNDKMAFLKSIPELSNISMTRSKLLIFCQSFHPVEYVKTQVLYNEGEPCKYLYFIR